MRSGTGIAIIGAIVTIFGVIFHLQGQGHVGPESSFMYTNPEWTTNGVIIVIVGIAIIILGLIMARIKR